MDLYIIFRKVYVSTRIISNTELRENEIEKIFRFVFINIETHLPTKFSNTELFPADCPPTTAIWGRSSCICTPNCVKASCSLFTIGINCSIPMFPDMAAGFLCYSLFYELSLRCPSPTDFLPSICYGFDMRMRKSNELWYIHLSQVK